MLATHLGLLLRQFNKIKAKASALWQQQLNEFPLQENKRKAGEADKLYRLRRQDTE